MDVHGKDWYHEVLLLTTTGCSGSLVDRVWHRYNNLIVDGLIKQSHKFAKVDLQILGGKYLLS